VRLACGDIIPAENADELKAAPDTNVTNSREYIQLFQALQLMNCSSLLHFVWLPFSPFAVEKAKMDAELW